MARKATEELAARAAPKQDPAQDLAVLFPDQALTIAGVELTMREYRFAEGLRLQARAAPIVAEIAEVAADAGHLAPEAIDAALAAHPDAVAELIAQACDQPLDWVLALHGADADALFDAWWVVNSGFFVRRIQRAVLYRRAAASAGRASSAPSSNTGTANATSAGIPRVN